MNWLPYRRYGSAIFGTLKTQKQKPSLRHWQQSIEDIRKGAIKKVNKAISAKGNFQNNLNNRKQEIGVYLK